MSINNQEKITSKFIGKDGMVISVVTSNLFDSNLPNLITKLKEMKQKLNETLTEVVNSAKSKGEHAGVPNLEEEDDDDDDEEEDNDIVEQIDILPEKRKKIETV
uniref:Uncharacterized protein n=1 Tax=Clastoptera arizonana TaxID=38151 RepID=A0A1B6CTC7_9HEMI